MSVVNRRIYRFWIWGPRNARGNLSASPRNLALITAIYFSPPSMTSLRIRVIEAPIRELTRPPRHAEKRREKTDDIIRDVDSWKLLLLLLLRERFRPPDWRRTLPCLNRNTRAVSKRGQRTRARVRRDNSRYYLDSFTTTRPFSRKLSRYIDSGRSTSQKQRLPFFFSALEGAHSRCKRRLDYGTLAVARKQETVAPTSLVVSLLPSQ